MTAHCCEMMRLNVENTCEQHPVRNECVDALLDYWPASGTYVMLIHDGGQSGVVISYCPWCGVKLPDPIEAEALGAEM